MSIFDTVRKDGPAAPWTGHPSLPPGVLVLVLTATGMPRGSWSLGRSQWPTRAFARMVRGHLTPAPPRLQVLADRLGIGARLTMVDLSRPFALTYGITHTRVLVSTGLLACLTGAELAAVPAHERAHLRSRDPLKNLVARAITARHFYLPGLSRLRHRFTAGRELAADRAALADRIPDVPAVLVNAGDIELAGEEQREPTGQNRRAVNLCQVCRSRCRAGGHDASVATWTTAGLKSL